MAIANVSQPLKNKVSCDVCLANVDDANTEVADASKYCIECRENLCDTCSLHHNRQKLSKSHQVVLYGSQVKEELVKKFVTQFCHFCDQHKMEQLKMYCSDCKKVICIVCFAESHQLHKCLDVNKVAESLRNELEIDLEKVVEVFNEGFAKQQELETEKKELLEELVSTEKTIIDRATTLKKLVDGHAKCLLDELAALKTKQLREIETKLDDIRSYLAALKSFQTYCSEIKSKGTPSDICCSANDLRARGGDLTGMRTTKILPQTSSVQFSFAASKLEESLKAENIVGCIKVQTIRKEAKLKTQEENQQVGVNLIKILNFPSVILGITKLQNKIYVLYGVNDSHRYINTIDIIEDQPPFQLVKKVECKDIRNCRDIVSTDKLNCLFVSDTWNRCILKVSVDDYRVTRWLSKVGESFTLSVSSDGHLLVLRDGQPSSKLEIYGLDAKLIRSVILSTDIVCPVHVTQIQSEQFFVIHRLRDANSGSWVVSQISSDGMITNQFNAKKESGLTLCSCDMSVDSDNQRLFVADSESQNVVELDLNSLRYIGILLAKEQKATSNPHRLYYDVCKKMLIIGHSNSLEIYEVHRSN